MNKISSIEYVISTSEKIKSEGRRSAKVGGGVTIVSRLVRGGL